MFRIDVSIKFTEGF